MKPHDASIAALLSLFRERHRADIGAMASRRAAEVVGQLTYGRHAAAHDLARKHWERERVTSPPDVEIFALHDTMAAIRRWAEMLGTDPLLLASECAEEWRKY